jgi:hypothetical protein
MPRTRLPALLLAATAAAGHVAAQARLPVPSAAELAATGEALLRELARQAMRGDAAPAIDRLLAAAADGGRPAALRYALFRHAERCAAAAEDVAGALRAAARAGEVFAEPGDPASALERFHHDGLLPLPRLVGAWLHLGHTTTSDAAVHAAQRAEALAAAADLDLEQYAARAADDLRAATADRARIAALADPAARAAAELRHRALFDGDWSGLDPTALPALDPFARVLASKAHARRYADALALARCGEQWLDLAAREPTAAARDALRRRALHLLAPVALGGGAPVAEAERAWRLFLRTAAMTTAPGLGPVAFAGPAPLRQLHVDGGDWRVEHGVLLGTSLGPDVATRATTLYAFRRIDTVVIRGGIRSADGLNFRCAVGDVNVLCNWEVADENHVWFGAERHPSSPRRLVAGREHTLVLQQCDAEVLVAVDGALLARGPGRLAGPVTIYPALGSTIFVRAIEVVGDVDLRDVVRGPAVSR